MLTAAPSLSKTFTLLPDHSGCKAVQPLPLPGLIILVHGVNSDGEWFQQSEEGLCAGLNTRMARNRDQMAHPGVENGQLGTVSYMPELTPDGFINRARNANSFMLPTPSCSPVIRFRWGYKASKEELKVFGQSVWLNENNYWGGGPFQNGCSALPDLWSEGLNDRLFLWIHAQHVNPASERDVYGCPSRAYYVHAALRLAKLIQSIREIQEDCPITVVCHSQGNMIGLGAAFLADKLGVQADAYVLCNPPYSVVDSLFAESWAQRYTENKNEERGRVTGPARIETLKNFFDMMRKRAALEPDASLVTQKMGNECAPVGKPYVASTDRKDHGLNGHTYGRVTLYCNPHDQVISAATVQGIGWCGMSQEEITQAQGEGVFTQRVFAQGYTVGQAPGQSYNYWTDHWDKENVDKDKSFFWYPKSLLAQYSIKQGLDANQTYFGKFVTLLTAPIFYPIINVLRAFNIGMPINAYPAKDWKIPINAPALPEPFEPVTIWYGQKTAQFDQGFDPAGAARNRQKTEKDEHDLYDSHATEAVTQGQEIDPTTGQQLTDQARGSEASEAQMRYEDHARLRMKARRTGRAGADGKVEGEDQPDKASDDYKKWREEQLVEFFQEGLNQHATDHSTIVTNPEHAEKSMAYDVAIGLCDLSKITSATLGMLRMEADWRYSSSLGTSHPHFNMSDYFDTGKMQGQQLFEWVKTAEAQMPDTIVPDRQWKAPPNREGDAR